MKKILYLIIITFSVIGCSVEPVGQQPIDNIPPKQVSNINVENIAGGAIITYDLPDDEDLLYVKAVFSFKDGIISEVKSSLYSSSLKIQGFGDTNERIVKIISVDRSQNESNPVEVSISPLEPEVITIGNSLNLREDFGGISATWENPNNAEISVVFLQEDKNEEYVPLETYYSSLKEGSFSARGMDTIPINIAAYVQDRWENKSDIQYYTITPLYETKFDRLFFKGIVLSGDRSSNEVGGWNIERMWNGLNGDEGYSSLGGTGEWPHSNTIDLGVVGKLSRVRIYQRLGAYVFGAGNPRKFKVYGCTELDTSGDWDSWDLLMECSSFKPSGLPQGQWTDDDYHIASTGEDFVVPLDAPKVRYIRLLITQTWAGGDNYQISEIEFYGDNR